MGDSVLGYAIFGEESQGGASPAPAAAWQTGGPSAATAEILSSRESVATRLPLHRSPGQRRRTLRRFHGVLLESVREEARVLLIDGDERFEYWLPYRPLEKAGITVRNQPFELDEFEVEEDDGSYTTGYRYRPSASPKDVFADTLDLDPDRRRKLDTILRAFGHAQA